MTDGTSGLPGFERRMRELKYQFRAGGLMRIVAGKATRGLEGLLSVSLNQFGVFRIMTIHAQSRAVLLQLEIKFQLTSFARFMDGMAGLTTHI